MDKHAMQRPADMLADDRDEWLASLEYILMEFGESGVKEILRALYLRMQQKGITDTALMNTPYLNTISAHNQPPYPGNIELEKRIENILRWNAMSMVVRAVDRGLGLGGHIASYPSAATLLEVGLNHVFRKKSNDYGGDMVLFQGTTATGTYARALLEGRLGVEQLENYRRELQPGGLCSYSHPRSLPDFWEVPNGSMGLSVPTAIYQARFVKYLEARGLKPKNGGKVWCFIGDGETDEPEVLGMLNIAAREQLDNLVFIINCNLQRLDGPVRGNGKIVQELERSFVGAGWQVLKVLWGEGWDPMLGADVHGALRRRMEELVDGDYQRLSTLDAAAQRQVWINDQAELEILLAPLSDRNIDQLRRGGHDHKKIYAAYHRALNTRGKPTVILAKTVKGDRMGAIAQGSNTAHQKKVLSQEDRRYLAREYQIPLSEEEIDRADYYLPGDDSDEARYVREHRQALKGFIPERRLHEDPLEIGHVKAFGDFQAGSGDRALSTTGAMVRLLSKLLKDSSIGAHIVPIVPDEARTFGMESLFKSAGIYSPLGQLYTPVDAGSLIPYRESENGQLLQEGICETGAMGSFLAAGTAHTVHGIPMIPFYFFYSMFGPQRVADMMWHCADMHCRGFMFGGTAGRTTLHGEGIQHQDGHSHVMASTIPNLLSYDPAFAYEVEVIVRDGMKRMYENQESIFYYLTLYNENYPMPAKPEQEGIDEGIRQGLYCFRRSQTKAPQVHLLSSGSIMQQALYAAEVMESMGYAAHVWSATSFIELSREARETARQNRLHPQSSPRLSYVERLFENESGVFIAATDYMQSLPESISSWMPRAYTVLGTDGFGLSESRDALRDHFEVSADYIIHAALSSLYRQGEISQERFTDQIADLHIDPEKQNPRAR